MIKFVKTKECSYIVVTTIFESKHIKKGKMYFLGAHDHLTICNKYKELEEINDEDTLYDIWYNDNITNDFEYSSLKRKIS